MKYEPQQPGNQKQGNQKLETMTSEQEPDIKSEISLSEINRLNHEESFRGVKVTTTGNRKPAICLPRVDKQRSWAIKRFKFLILNTLNV